MKRDDDSDIDDTPRVVQPAGKPGQFATLLSVFGVAAWVALMLAMLLGGVLFILALRSANGAPQEAAAGAVFSTVFIGLYVLVRCVEKIIAGVTKIL